MVDSMSFSRVSNPTTRRDARGEGDRAKRFGNPQNTAELLRIWYSGTNRKLSHLRFSPNANRAALPKTLHVGDS